MMSPQEEAIARYNGELEPEFEPEEQQEPVYSPMRKVTLYAPLGAVPAEAVLNMEHVVSITEDSIINDRRPIVCVTLTHGEPLLCFGTLDDFLI